MGSNQSSETLHCNRYLNGQGPPSLEKAAHLGPPTPRTQPPGQMTWVVLHRNLPGYPHDDTLQVNFTFPEGVQMEGHPHPGQPYPGLRLCAYVPDSRDGRRVLSLLEKAFQQQLLFTVSTNVHGEDVVSPASVPLKTQQEGGAIMNGYPDEDYLKKVRAVLKEKLNE
ncbi:E3 ubiquitin-protein ligase DTX3L1 [Boleophthalmus pectinirostris]|uniref:E3 ubiquitin-protein ligase DTX3L1 n=1 Tax=Boleophthalmus pectinirostris TaxID=150288 RepID=UPI000A1C29A3|nr:E3 ubiquitin-protein ligase DTX3L1 [Boleophthalmus pectinirostris]